MAERPEMVMEGGQGGVDGAMASTKADKESRESGGSSGACGVRSGAMLVARRILGNAGYWSGIGARSRGAESEWKPH
jgi:hypothetical protein